VRRIVAGLSLQWPGFDIRPTHLVFVVNTVALRHDFILVRRVSPVSIRPSIFHTHYGHYIIIAIDYVNNPSTERELKHGLPYYEGFLNNEPRKLTHTHTHTHTHIYIYIYIYMCVCVCVCVCVFVCLLVCVDVCTCKNQTSRQRI
jgi:hypothetical protein